MEVIIPQLGYFVWSLLIFLIFFIILAKFAWKPIMASIKERETDIENSLSEAKKAKEEMAKLNSENEALLKEARIERDAILKEAREMKESIVSEAKTEAAAEAKRILDDARSDIQSEKMAALMEIKNTIGKLSIDIAEKVLRKELESKEAQSATVEKMVSEINFN